MSSLSRFFGQIDSKVRALHPWHPVRAWLRGLKHAPSMVLSGAMYLHYRLRKPLTVVVLGMHRSGTSFTTRAINLLGARVGNNLFERSESNPRGFWEHGFPVHINKRLLELAGGRWDEPPGDVEFGHLTRFRMRLFLGRLHNGDVNTAVWKDPRTLLTFPLWKEEMIHYVPVFVFRHPMSVASSLHRRNGFSMEKGLRLWTKYNRRLLEIDNREGASYFINFDGGLEHITEVLKAIASLPGLSFDAEASEFYDENLRSPDTRSLMDDRTSDVYTELKTRVE